MKIKILTSFTIQYPINWQRTFTVNVPDVSGVKFCPIPSSPKIKICSLNTGIVYVTAYFSPGLAKSGLSIPGLGNPSTLDGVTEQKISDARSYGSLIDSSSTTLGGLQAHKIEYMSNGQNATHYIEVYALTDDGSLYDISFKSTQENFGSKLPQAEQIINSFAIR